MKFSEEVTYIGTGIFDKGGCNPRLLSQASCAPVSLRGNARLDESSNLQGA